jgi:NCS1 family nucleobase:cation symporter-1
VAAAGGGLVRLHLQVAHRLLGAVGGILIADNFLVRRTRLDPQASYQWGGSCWYTGGFHAAGLLAPAAGVIPCVPGSLATIGLVEVMPS